ncbi:type II toxin-antitoxin system VapC family toxin [Xenorhabdus bovienii]|uniref:Type II toxin-antitoxin system VapC family toxin n=1 Tax=Xenorhabdus bovienii TaxID=40576 RepID=A0AAJ1J887_XENBV|nr:type II toxin-antitoxin system VapC family toxin [Xenorhabdus bovienii]MDE1473898.1 type II toxin-antitoxin system VapC family toxin [Xenorhabdus bovienii]MDE1478006.1 type II toxin-antitoxin system VapC family toxin [Xenorhabdus bovienii]MDE1487280.1 type II toxin-antitoxin system VapC family toxin [Xenorhabdus bovienii]MDE1491562.1 type II toxin-antitoxin system VapC family toxin [Xenorhabdus bovienii]MDE1495804.1 type II toxin-antitoxin system VapC family toxin [Xenorhabdus bovienii]
MKKVYMLDTNICSFIMREKPVYLLEKLQECVMKRHTIVVSAITYSEMRFGAIGKKASPRHNVLVDAFCERLDAILPWDKEAIDATVTIKKCLSDVGMPIGNNDTAIAGHAIAVNAILVTNNTREFSRVEGLKLEDWTKL